MRTPALPRPLRAIERNFAYRRRWMAIGTGVFEPLSYLLAFGFVLGAFIDPVETPAGPVAYRDFVLPAMVAVAVANGGVYGATAVFGRLQFDTVYQGMLVSPLGPRDIAGGELLYATFRGVFHGVLLLAAGLLLGIAPVRLAALPAIVLIAYAFAGVALAVTTCLKSYQELALIEVVLFGLVLTSGTFFPLSIVPQPAQFLLGLTPLWHAVELIRGILAGAGPGAATLHVVYLLVLGTAGAVFAVRRVDAMFLEKR
jgi:lipooligosaccharide transport system permease protein